MRRPSRDSRAVFSTILAAGLALAFGLSGCSSGGGKTATGGGSAGGGVGGGIGATGGAGGTASAGAGGASRGGAGGVTMGRPTAASLLAKVESCAKTALKGGFGLDGPGAISIDQCPGALMWKADMDVDCDGIQSPPCNTDVTGQPQTSIVDDVPSGDVDPTKLPYFVIPLGTPETTWYMNYGVALGQVGAVIYKGQVEYGIFADEAGGFFIGESSYAMCQLFLGARGSQGDPCDPNEGGIDPADVTYVTFTGPSNRVSGKDIYDHAKHDALGASAAAAWLAAP